MQELLFFTAHNALLLGLALRLGSRLLSDQPSWRRVTGTLLLLPVISGLCLEILDVIGPITSPRVAALLVIALILEFVIPRATAPASRDDHPAHRMPGVQDLVLFSGLLGLWVAAVQTTLWRGTFYHWDDLTYHAAIPAFWAQTASLDLYPFTYQAYFPLNSELFSFWFMLPMGNDSQVGFALLIWISLGLAGFLAIGRNLAQNVSLTIVMASFMLVSPNFIAHLRSFNGVDLSVAALCLAALAFARSDASTPARMTRDAFFCGLAAGMAAGAKTPFLALCVLLAGWWGIQGGKGTGSARLRPVAIFAIACLLSGSYWYFRNLLLTGNPFFPAELGPFAGPLDRATQITTSMVGQLNELGWDGRTLFTIVKMRMKLPMPLGFLFVAGLVFAPLQIIRRRRENPQGSWRYLALVAGTGLLLLALHPFQPFSGTVNRPHAGMQHNVRFILASVVLGWAVFPSAIPNARRWIVGVGLICIGALVYTAADLSLSTLRVAAISGVLSFLLLLAWRRWPQPRLLLALPAVVAGLLLIVAFARMPQKAVLAEHRLYALAGFGSRFDDGWMALDALPDGSRVAYLSNVTLMANFYYPQFGRALQLVPVPIGYDGQLRPPLHVSWTTRPQHWWWDFRRDPSVDPKLISNLQSAGVDFILVNRWTFAMQWNRNPDWPEVRRLLQHSSAARLAYADDDSEIYDLR